MTRPAKSPTSYDPQRVDALAAQLVKYRRLYYAGKPAVADAEYDRLEDELRQLAPSHPVLQRVGAAPSAEAVKLTHATPMLSLNKTYRVEDLVAWMGGHPLVGTLKVDGVSISLIYEDGALVRAKTRGDGRVGEDVTAKLAWVADALPRLVAQKDRKIPKVLEVRGELYCTESRFVALSEAFAELGLERPTSPRNIVAGLLGRKNHIELSRFFNFFAFGVELLSQDAPGFKTETEGFEWLGELGFALPKPKRLTDAAAVHSYLEYVRKVMDEDEIGIDGAVFSYDELRLHRELGVTAHHPRAKLSFKWQGQTAHSTIKEVVWATSRLGIVTPVAVIEPVILSGATITNVTLHNAAHVKAYNLKKGDVIEIVRSGEVIPKFLSVVEAAPGSYAWPKHCPACRSELRFDDVRLVCSNTLSCPAQQIGGILNWIVAAGIDDLSEKRLAPLIEHGKVRTISDLYALREDDFFVVPQVKAKMAAKLYKNIQQSRTLPLPRFLTGLGIEGAGATTWERLLAVFPGLTPLRRATVDAIAGVSGFAQKTAEQIVSGLAMKAELIDALLAAGVAPVYAPASAAAETGPLAGKTFVITGALTRPRAEVEADIKAAGGKVSGAVSKTTYAVITDEPESTSTKMQKARELGIEILTEAALMNLISQV